MAFCLLQHFFLNVFAAIDVFIWVAGKGLALEALLRGQVEKHCVQGRVINRELEYLLIGEAAHFIRVVHVQDERIGGFVRVVGQSQGGVLEKRGPGQEVVRADRFHCIIVASAGIIAAFRGRVCAGVDHFII